MCDLNCYGHDTCYCEKATKDTIANREEKDNKEEE
jgi:hypothetical protein